MANKTFTPTPTPATREIRATPRVSAAFSVLQSLVISLMAKAGTPTADIATKLGVDRSYVIRLAVDGVPLAPTNAREKLLLDIASGEDFARRIQNLGLKGLLGGENLPIVLAGNAENPRPKLGPLSERRAAKEAAPAPEPKPKRAPKAAPAPEPAPEPKPKRGKKADVTKDGAMGGDTVQGEVKPKRGKAKSEAAPAPEPKPARVAKRNRGVPTNDAPTADDILGVG